MLRIGIVGTENSHANQFVRHLNIEQHRSDARVVALGGGNTEKNQTLAADGQIELIVDSLSDITDQIDAAVVCDRHGAKHAPNALPLLRAGKHVFVDKPTATTVDDVEAMVEAARTSGAVLTSWSILRQASGIDQLRATAAQDTPVALQVSGPANPANPHAGLFFYGPHVVELALEILGNPTLDGDVAVHRTSHAVTAVTRAGGTQLTLTFATTADASPTSWHTTIASSTGLISKEFTTDMLNHGSGLDRFLDAAIAGKAPDPYAQLITPVALLAAVTEQL